MSALLLAIAAGAAAQSGEAAQSVYEVGVDYHALGQDFENTGFLSSYHDPAVREIVRGQLQDMADRGARVISTRVWMLTTREGPTRSWGWHFPPTEQEAANLRTFAEDVAAVVASDGHGLQLDVGLLWLWAANFRVGTPETTLGNEEELAPAEFTRRVEATTRSVVESVHDVLRSDGQKVVATVYFDGEVMIGAKDNQRWFLRAHYADFVELCRSHGLTPSIYFLAVGEEAHVFDDDFVDPAYPVLNGHRSMYWIHRSVEFLRDEGLPIPERIDFSCYVIREPGSSTPFRVLVERIFDDADATLPTLGAPRRYGVAETGYLPSRAERRELGAAFAAERGRVERLTFWTTPDSGGPGVHAGFPFAVEDYLPR